MFFEYHCLHSFFLKVWRDTSEIEINQLIHFWKHEFLIFFHFLHFYLHLLFEDFCLVWQDFYLVLRLTIDRNDCLVYLVFNHVNLIYLLYLGRWEVWSKFIHLCEQWFLQEVETTIPGIFILHSILVIDWLHKEQEVVTVVIEVSNNFLVSTHDFQFGLHSVDRFFLHDLVKRIAHYGNQHV